MEVAINGEPRRLSEESITLKDFLESSGIRGGAFAVALNAEVVPRSEFPKINLKEGDRLEILRPVGGG